MAKDAKAPAGAASETSEKKYTPKHTVKELNESARQELIEAAGDPAKYKALLDTIAKFPSYSAMNAAHIAKAAPDARVLKDSEAWNKEGNHIKKGESGIPISAPDPKDRDAEGKPYFRVKYLFSDAQVAKPVKVEELVGKRLEEAFGSVEAPAPYTPEAVYIIGKHFGLEGAYLKEGTLPPADLFEADELSQVASNLNSYINNVRREANTFIRAVEVRYGELTSERTAARNSNLFERLSGPAKGQEKPMEAAKQAEQPPVGKQPEPFEASLDEAEARAVAANAEGPAQEAPAKNELEAGK